MHDETPGGLAVKDRALAYWTDLTNFPTVTPRKRFTIGFAIGTFVSMIFGGVYT